ncbi:MAG TPA: TlpA disulfide reductase family protein [Fibrobacteria bacterium]|jgi:thiol-disulfide isomerase/thioredoxin|nr:TlpA disulfide reductase family protein [Fibrobacteria bacterium]
MKIRFSVFTLALCAAFLFFGCKKPAPANQIHPVTLKTYSGDSVTIGPNDGKVTLVVFWATWCVPCIEEIPQLKDFQKRFAPRGFRVMAINIDDPEGNTAPTLMEQFEMNYPVLVEVDGKAEEAFGGLRALPTSFLVGRDGVVKARLEGLYPPETLEKLILKEL